MKVTLPSLARSVWKLPYTPAIANLREHAESKRPIKTMERSADIIPAWKGCVAYLESAVLIGFACQAWGGPSDLLQELISLFILAFSVQAHLCRPQRQAGTSLMRSLRRAHSCALIRCSSLQHS